MLLFSVHHSHALTVLCIIIIIRCLEYLRHYLYFKVIVSAVCSYNAFASVTVSFRQFDSGQRVPRTSILSIRFPENSPLSDNALHFAGQNLNEVT